MTNPRQSGFWKADTTHTLYWEIYGAEHGRKVVMLHGGPGSGRDTYLADYFDLTKIQVLMFDQRGVGKSTPQGCLITNTTNDLVSDINGITVMLGWDKFILSGGSWGATLALRFAVAHSKTIEQLIIYSTFLGRAEDEAWTLYGTRAIYPDLWDRMTEDFSDAERANISEAMFKRLNVEDEAQWQKPGQGFLMYLKRLLTVQESSASAPVITREIRNGLLIFLHYSRNNYFLGADGALEGLDALSSLPITIIHGALDMDSRVSGAAELKQILPQADLTIIPNCGHSDREAAMAAALMTVFQAL